MELLLRAILADDRPRVRHLIASDPSLVSARVAKATFYDQEIFHWLYVGDTVLHLAAAGHRQEIVTVLLDAGSDVNAATNHRRSGPLHYAADGYITGQAWDPDRQVATLLSLLRAGADLHAQDKNGATALHRAVRTRCAAAVDALLAEGADPRLRNKSGSTAFHLAVQNTGRGGSGADAAHAAQRRIIETLVRAGVSSSITDADGRSVRDWARSEWIRQLLG